MCEVLLPDGTPHPSNSRATIPDDPDTWFGFEQEYFFYVEGSPLGFPSCRLPGAAGRVLHRASATRTSAPVAREIVDAHLDLCLEAGINHEGINAEVAKGQWEFQIFGKGSKRAADEMWIARYLLLRLCERYGVDVNWHCKPLGVEVDWNGSGMHTNFSTKYMREVGGEEYFHALMAAFEQYMEEHIEVYGPDNHLRLTGLHETQSIDTFSWGVADRGASIRVPHSFVNNGYKGYLEDRRPNSQGDPYRIAGRIIESIAAVPLPGAKSAGARRRAPTETACRIGRAGRWSSASRGGLDRPPPGASRDRDSSARARVAAARGPRKASALDRGERRRARCPRPRAGPPSGRARAQAPCRATPPTSAALIEKTLPTRPIAGPPVHWPTASA